MSEALPGGDAGPVPEFAALVPGGVLVVDPDGTPVWADERARGLFGLDGTADIDAASVGSAADRAPPHERAIERGGPVRGVECRLALGDGSRRVSLDATPLTNGDGTVDGVALAVEPADTAAPGTDGEATAMAEAGDGGAGNGAAPPAAAGDVFERIDDAFFALDRDWRFTYLNEQAERLLDRDRAGLIGEVVWDRFPEAVDTAFQEKYERAMSTGEPVTFEAHYPPLESWFEVRAYPSETGLSVYFRDVTERKTRERRLERYRTAVEAAEEGIYIVDEDRRFTEVNEAYASMVGSSREALLGSHVSTVVDDEDVLASAEQLEAELLAGERETASLEAEFTDDDGETWVGEAVFALVETDRGHERVGIVRDVTERKARERKLAASRRRYRALVDNFPNGVVALFDAEPRFTLVGGSTLSEMERSAAEIEGEPVESVIPPDIAGELLRNFRATIEGEHRTFTVASGGEVRRVRTVPIRDSSGTVRRGLAFSQDVTDQLVRERRLHRQREQLDALNDLNSLVQEVSAAAVQRSDPEGVRATVRQRFEASDSYGRAQLWTVGPDRASLVPADGPDAPAATPLTIPADPADSRPHPAVKAASTGEPQIVRRLGDATTGPWADAAADAGHDVLAAVPITSGDAMYGVLTVCTGREDAFGRAERAALDRFGTVIAHAIRSVHQASQLRRSEQLYRTLAENLPNGVVTMTDTDLRFRALAGELIDELDAVPRDLRGKRPTEVEGFPPGVGDRIEAALTEVLDGATVSRQLDYGDHVLALQAVPVRDETGAVVGTMTLSRDITERVARREQLEYERERLEFLVRLVRHNLLNSLNVVDGRLDLMEGRVDYEVAPDLETARDRTQRMIDLVETIRSLTNAAADSGDQQLEPVALEPLLTEQVESAALTFPDAEFDLGTVPDVPVLADDLLAEVVENLLHNAVEHNDAATPEVRVTATASDESVTVAVADNGPGLPDRVAEEVAGARARDFDDLGSGFGLYIAQEVADSYGGDLSAVDNDPEGTVFRLTLPRPDESA